MKLSTENGIRSFLMKISKHCIETDCSVCPFMTGHDDGTNFDCAWRECVPMNWNINDIMKRFKKLKE